MILAPRLPTPPRLAVPAGACDTHAHVYAEPYPVDNASYAIPSADPASYRRMLATDPRCSVDRILEDPEFRGEFLNQVWPNAGGKSEFDILHGLNNLRKRSKLPRRGD